MKIFALRFFTVYGEWGRPDMFMIKYLQSAHMGKSLIYIIMEITKEILLILKMF